MFGSGSLFAVRRFAIRRSWFAVRRFAVRGSVRFAVQMRFRCAVRCDTRARTSVRSMRIPRCNDSCRAHALACADNLWAYALHSDLRIGFAASVAPQTLGQRLDDALAVKPPVLDEDRAGV